MTKIPIWQARLTGAAILIAAALPGAAEPVRKDDKAIACGGFYTTQRGDSLSTIANRAYGWDKYPAIYLANRDVLHSKEVLPIGVDLWVPCLDGPGPATRREALAQDPDALDERRDPARSGRLWATAPAQTDEAGFAPAPVPAPDPLSAPEPEPAPELAAGLAPETGVVAKAPPAQSVEPVQTAEPVRTVVAAEPPPKSARLLLLTGTGISPLSDSNLRGGGLITQLVTRAIKIMAPGQPFSVTFVNDWDAHLNGLLLSGALDVGFPWVKPDCRQAERLSPQDQLLCSEFLFSKPMYELAIAYYVRRDSPLTGDATVADLAGKRLCRPRTRYSFDIEMPAPVSAGTSLLTAPTATACFERLLRNETDVVMVIRQEAEPAIRQSGIGGGAREIKGLADVRTMHAIAPKGNPNGSAFLELIDAGMEQLMSSGEWFQIVAAHHARQVAQVQ